MSDLTATHELLSRLGADMASCYEEYKQRRDRIEERYRSDMDEAWDAYQQQIAPIRKAQQGVLKSLAAIEATKPLTIMVKK